MLICDVGPRDGLQNEPETLAPAVRAELVDRLAATGLRRIEAVSFVRDDRVPQMAAAEQVVEAIAPHDGVEYAGLAAALEADEVVLADTIGVAGPSQVRSLLERVTADGRRAGFHGHNTRNTGYANCLAAIEAGATVLDASVGGLGGCPYAPKATGNVATEDLVYLLGREGVVAGVDLDALIGISEWLAGVLGRRLDGQVYRAGRFPPA